MPIFHANDKLPEFGIEAHAAFASAGPRANSDRPRRSTESQPSGTTAVRTCMQARAGQSKALAGGRERGGAMRHPGCRTRALAEGNGIRRHMQQRRAGGVVVPSPRDVRKRSWLMFSPDRRPRTDASPPRTQNPPTTRSVPKGAGPDAGLHPPTGTSDRQESQPTHPVGRH